MNIKMITLIIFTSFLFACDEHEEIEPRITEYKRGLDLEFSRSWYDGHSYILATETVYDLHEKRGRGDDTHNKMGMTHDPDCSCLKVDEQ